jgi:hypothetical protein
VWAYVGFDQPFKAIATRLSRAITTVSFGDR